MDIRDAVDSNTGAPLPQPRGFRPAEFEGKKYFVRLGMHIVKCTGEAHSNAFIDNCMRCAPHWGHYAVSSRIQVV